MSPLNLEQKNSLQRRDFFKWGSLVTAGLIGQTAFGKDSSAQPSTGVGPLSMPTRNLGRTGHQVPLFSLGGQAALEHANNEATAIPIIERALELGIRYIDTSSIYGGEKRWSERYIGAALKTHRREVLLASKSKERSRDGSLRMLEESLKLLQTDYLDIWQLHDIGLMEDVEAVFRQGGAMEAFEQARQQKMVRWLGITGHFRPEPLMEALRRFSFDTILLAVNAADPYHFSFMSELLPLAVEKKLGIIGMKIPARGRLLSSWTPPPLDRQEHSWEGAVIAKTPGTLTLKEALDFSLTLPISTAIIGCDSIQQLEENVQLAREFTPLSQKQMEAISAKAQPVAKQSLFFRFVSRP
jgi:aryl-alcohol dehydrogenase-like predicted oxidoreductase